MWNSPSKFLLYIQGTVEELTEQLVSHLQLADSRRKQNGLPSSIGKELKERIRSILKNITKGLLQLPSAYFGVVIKLLNHANYDVKRKVVMQVHLSFDRLKMA